MTAETESPILYRIIRYYRVSGRRKVIHRGVTLQVAQLHCNDPRTSRKGVWFDGYEQYPAGRETK